MNGRRRTILFLAGLAAAPFVIEKLRSNLLPAAPALLTLHKEPTSTGALDFVDETGATRQLSNFPQRFLLVNIWATWCPPCRTEMPSLDRLKGVAGESSSFDVLAVSVDRVSMAQLRAFYNSYDITHLKLFRGDETALLAALRVPGLPTTILFDAQRQELGRLVGPTEWDSTAVREQLSAYDARLAPAEPGRSA